MTRINKIQKKAFEPKFTEFYSAVENLLGRVPNFYKTFSNSPFLAMAFLPINALAQREWEGTSVSGKIKELIVIKTSQTNGCKYCYAHNTSLGNFQVISQVRFHTLGVIVFYGTLIKTHTLHL